MLDLMQSARIQSLSAAGSLGLSGVTRVVNRLSGSHFFEDEDDPPLAYHEQRRPSGGAPLDNSCTNSSADESGDDVWVDETAALSARLDESVSEDEIGLLSGLPFLFDEDPGNTGNAAWFAAAAAADTLDTPAIMNLLEVEGGEEAVIAEAIRRSMEEEEAPKPRMPRVEESVIAALPVTRLSFAHIRRLPGNHKCCAVCLEDFKSQDYQKTLPCKHRFHPQCIDECLRHSSACPICRADVAARGLAQKFTCNDYDVEEEEETW